MPHAEQIGFARVVTVVRAALRDGREVLGGHVDVELGDGSTEIGAQIVPGGVIRGADVALEPSRDAADAVAALLEYLLDQEVLPGRRPGLVGQGILADARDLLAVP